MDSSPSGGKGKIVAVGLGAVGVLAVGFLAVRFLLGGDAGGAASPEAVVEDMVAGINAQDPLAVVDLIAPDEVDGVDELVEDATRYFEDLGLDDLLAEQQDDEVTDVELAIDLALGEVEVSMEGDDAAVVSFSLAGDVGVDGDDTIRDTFGDDEVSFDSRDLTDVLPTDSGDPEMVVVRIDGDWYFSPMLTAGHYLAASGAIPPGDYDRIGADDRADGADSPEAAVQSFFDVVNDPDADALAASLGGGEGRVAVAFRDAFDDAFSEIEAGAVGYEFSVDTEDIGSGRVELARIEFGIEDEFSTGSAVVEDGCLVASENGEVVVDECLVDALGLPAGSDFDTTLWLDTVEEGGGHRVRLVPTIFDSFGRFFDITDDRQTLLLLVDAPQDDVATTVEPGSDVSIDFDGQRFVVSEFAIEAGEAYHVTATDGARVDLFVDGEFGEQLPVFDPFFVAETDGMARVVVYSEFDESGSCTALGCFPTGEGSTTLRIRQAARQSVPFPSILSGELGPGDIRVFDLEVDDAEVAVVDVAGESVDWMFDRLLFEVGPSTYDFPAGTHRLVVVNESPESSTSYTVTPSPG